MGNKGSKPPLLHTTVDCMCYAFAKVVNEHNPNAKDGIGCSCFSDHALDSLQGRYKREEVLKKTIKVALEVGFTHEDVLLKLFADSDPFALLFCDPNYRKTVKRFFAML